MSKSVDSNLYDRDYYLKNNVGFEEFLKGEEGVAINYKFKDVLACCNFEGDRQKKVLDIGCGRGEMVFYSAKAGALAVGIDYSKAAIEIANNFKDGLSDSIKNKMTFLNVDAGDLQAEGEFDYIFFIEVWEHMYDDQLKPLLEKVRALLKNDGSFIITTPNGFYERYLYPTKRITHIPFNLVKFPLRILRGKWKPKSLSDFLKHVFKVKSFSDAFMDKTHVNISSPLKIKKMLQNNGFNVEVKCWDDSKNLLSILFSRWAGREMLIVAKKKV